MKKTLYINKEDNINPEKLKKLTYMLKRLNTEELTSDLRDEAIEMVKKISPLEISLAEQKLIDEGMNPNELRHLCDIHMEILKDELKNLEEKISVGHILYTFIREHDEIMKFLNELEKVNSEIQKMNSYDDEKVEKVLKLSINLLNAEPHHKREEDVLFPKMESLGITGPTRIMKLEHESLRKKKRELKEICGVKDYIPFEEFKNIIDSISKDLIFELRDHIFKENYILYPTAMESINEKEFKELKVMCDEMGYCEFTPKELLI
ncbi:hypothetical protein HMPREF1092_01336 [Clostridium thermobutyricum]|uniref:DUF438 domain-containing protein n=1 Tax=Clostridium thermobutyricum TaxID=29372 RepID=N9WG95_9CLOT|nr:DUF438 domain-containing protein [Clostridium thermobutyricum]ENZ02101.1 hypothetical protein HMPREF1092_01336 [Clostridium thermobutyricum]